MGLDATVYCDCYEKGRTRIAPPNPDSVFVDVTGQLCFRSDDLQQNLQFDKWRQDACKHPDGELITHWLGNYSMVVMLRDVLDNSVLPLPILQEKVLYHYAHSGDHLVVSEVEMLVVELKTLSCLEGRTEHEERFVRRFEQQMTELVEAALSVRKPIAF
jgi:hypothetical protein